MHTFIIYATICYCCCTHVHMRNNIKYTFTCANICMRACWPIRVVNMLVKCDGRLSNAFSTNIVFLPQGSTTRARLCALHALLLFWVAFVLGRCIYSFAFYWVFCLFYTVLRLCKCLYLFHSVLSRQILTIFISFTIQTFFLR